MIRLSVVSTFGLFLSLTALATPKVGDSATYNIVQTSGDQSLSAVRTSELVNFDAQQNKYLERDTTHIDGRADQVEENWMDAGQFLSDQNIDNVLANCAQVGGAMETVAVPAGSFSACKLPVNSNDLTGFAWIAKVSLGIVKADLNQGGVHQTMELVSFH